MYHLAPLISDLALMLSVAGIIVLLFQRIRQPIVLGYLIAGILIGPHVWPKNLVSDIPNIQTLSELGVIFLMFSLGLEFSFHKLIRVGFSALITGCLGVGAMLIIGYFVGRALGWSYYDCIFLAAAISISSTTIIVKAISELNLKNKRFAELVFGILIVEDLLAILLLVALSNIYTQQNMFSEQLFFAAGKLILVVGAWVLIGYFLVPTFFRGFAKYISQETLTIISVALCLFLVCVAASLQYSVALGAFIMGSILAETLLVHRIEELIAPIRDIFAAVFFISVGMLINPSLIAGEWPAVFFIGFVLIISNILVIGLAALLTGQSLSTAVRAGFSLAQIGEFSFIIAALGVSLKVVSPSFYPIIVAVSVLTTFTTPYMIRLSGKMIVVLNKVLPDRIKYILDAYAAWIYRVQSRSNKNLGLNKVITRFCINGIIVAIIFLLAHRTVYPYLLKLFNHKYYAKPLSECVAIIFASPFIWGMLFSYQTIDFARSKLKKTPMIFIVSTLTLFEIILLSVIFFHTWFMNLILFLLTVLYFFILYRYLALSYQWFERRLVRNIKHASTKQVRYNELAPWETHLVEIEVGANSKMIGKTLSENKIRENYGINIVAIWREEKMFAAPRGEEIIAAHDRLIILGTDEQIDAFRGQVALPEKTEPNYFLANFTLKPFLLGEKNAAVGKSIRESKIREKINGIVVGLERDNKRKLNPDPQTILKAGDLLFLVGEMDKLKRLSK